MKLTADALIAIFSDLSNNLVEYIGYANDASSNKMMLDGDWDFDEVVKKINEYMEKEG